MVFGGPSLRYVNWLLIGKVRKPFPGLIININIKFSFMAEKKTIVVFGATGAQGGGLAHAILNDPASEFSVRAVTRDPDSDKAKELAARGAEVVAGDVDDPESLAKVLKGAYGAFFRYIFLGAFFR